VTKAGIAATPPVSTAAVAAITAASVPFLLTGLNQPEKLSNALDRAMLAALQFSSLQFWEVIFSATELADVTKSEITNTILSSIFITSHITKFRDKA
jgi:hypothetical protein